MLQIHATRDDDGSVSVSVHGEGRCIASSAASFLFGRTPRCSTDDVVAAARRALSHEHATLTELAALLQDAPAPAAWAAFDVAVAVRARARGIPRAALLSSHFQVPVPPSVRSALLIRGDTDLTGDRALWPTVKIKVPATSAAGIARVVAAGHRVRLDGNGALSLDALSALVACTGPALEFAEEPCAPPLLAAAAARCPLALDESLLRLTIADAVDLGARFVVLKPAALGPFRTLQWAQDARAAGLGVVISSVGGNARVLPGLVALHAAWGTTDAGLGVHEDGFRPDGRFDGAIP